jgi:hypothetical protein
MTVLIVKNERSQLLFLDGLGSGSCDDVPDIYTNLEIEILLGVPIVMED